jgi:predicted transposase/invertase (TIGR01784 family)
MIASEKLSILDLHVSTKSKLDINIEIQLINQYNMIKRTVYYMVKMLINQINRTITINILNFDFLNGDEYIKNYRFFEQETKKPLTDLIELIFIELPKFSRINSKYIISKSKKEDNENLIK